MGLALPLVAGLGVAAILGGDLRKLGELRLRALWLFYLALGLQVVAFPFGRLPWRTSDGVASMLWLASYALILAAAGLNRRVPGVPVVVAGLLCNLGAVLVNGGHMPVRPAAMHAAGYDYAVHANSAALAHPHLSWLIDRWAAPSWLPGANVFSVGDVIIAIGAFTFVLAATGTLTSLRGSGEVRVEVWQLALGSGVVGGLGLLPFGRTAALAALVGSTVAVLFVSWLVLERLRPARA
jgi:hypothetical protein